MKLLRHNRLNRRLVRTVFMVATSLVLSLPSTVSFAQDSGDRRNLFNMLFGAPRTERYERYERPTRRYDRQDGSIIEMAPRRQRSRAAPQAAVPRTRTAPIPSQPQAEPVAKLETAKKILVIGDFLAGNIGGELEATFATSPGVSIISRSDGSSGLVRDDHYDWLGQLPAILDEAKPAIVVVMLGANDRQQMDTASGREKFRTDAWFKQYETRVAELAGMIAQRKLTLLWVGLPAFQSPSMMADAVTLNTLYRGQVEKVGGEFVDIWDGFVDEDGRFVLTGSDVNGQQVRLRNSDGITLTKPGKEKLAFYVDKVLRRHLGDMASPDLAKFDSSTLPPLQTLESPANPEVPVRPISLVDPELDGGQELLGGNAPPARLTETPRDKLVKRGELEPAPAGRIDDYRLTTQ